MSGITSPPSVYFHAVHKENVTFPFFIKTLRSRCKADTTETAGLHYVKYELYIPIVHYHIAFCLQFPFVLSVWPFLRQSLRCATLDAICTLCCFVAWRPCN